MKKHKCKLCSRTFGNGRALGGHMKAHLALAKSQKQEEATIYGLRENPKKTLKISDPDFSFKHNQTHESVIVQDRESETESKNNPTRQQRSKRNRKQNINNNQNFEAKKPKVNSFVVATKTPSPLNDHEPVSSVSDTSPEEDVAMCLMMLSRDKWSRRRSNMNNVADLELETEEEEEEEEVIRVKLLKRVRGKHLSENCGKMFRSSRALGCHKSVCCNAREGKNGVNDKIFECPFCCKVFGSGQALGGHKRSHLMIPSSSNSIVNANPSARFKQSFIDLNLPAPLEDEEEPDDDLSVVSDA